MTPAKPASAMKTALVLAGGGSLGAVQVGMLRALLESGVEPDMVVGSSVGSINGAYFAGDPTLDGIAKLERLWCGLKRRDIFPWTWRRLFGFIRGRGHLVTSDGLTAPVVTDGPFQEFKEWLAGYQIVEVESEERAIEIAALVSAVPGRNGVPTQQPIHLRRVMDDDGPFGPNEMEEYLQQATRA